MSWIEEKYPIGRQVETAGGDGELHNGIITAHVQEGGIIVSFDGGGCNEFEASFLDESGNGPFVHDRRKPGRPVERAGTYQRITLEVRSDLLQKIDDSGKSRREYIEELLLQS
jgi:hypothetical protein